MLKDLRDLVYETLKICLVMLILGIAFAVAISPAFLVATVVF